MNPDAIYFDFIRCEDKSADLYLDLSLHFWDRVDLSWFWIEMAMEEKQSAGLLLYCLQNKVFSSDLPNETAIQNLKQRLDELGPRASDPALTLDGAFDIAIRIETSAINDIRSRLTMPIQGPAHVVQKKLDVSCMDHFGKLRSGAERFAVQSALRSLSGRF